MAYEDKTEYIYQMILHLERDYEGVSFYIYQHSGKISRNERFIKELTNKIETSRISGALTNVSQYQVAISLKNKYKICLEYAGPFRKVATWLDKKTVSMSIDISYD